MLKFCEKNKGAISVFLCLILLPTLIVGGLTTDAARIYLSKVMISDAGEMAMNAALAQYNVDLLDKYGLFVMDKKPSEIETQLETFFNESLNSTGVGNPEQYKRILDMVTEKFDALEMEGSQIYKTEVEKQQIIEYMKYRAPVCLTELVLEKLGALDKVDEMAEAMESQLEFAEDMEEVQDVMEDAKLALDNLINHMRTAPTVTQMNQSLESVQRQYTTDMAKALMMLSAISGYTKKSDLEAENAAENFISCASDVDMGNILSENTFEAYLECLFYKNDAEKIDRLVNEHKEKEPEEKEGTEYTEWKEELERLEGIQRDYNSAETSISGYPNALRNKARSIISQNRTVLSAYFENAVKGEQLAGKAVEKLEAVKKALETAKISWKTWSDKTDVLEEQAGEMKKSVQQYGDFFKETGEADEKGIEVLLNKTENNENYFKMVWENIIKEKFYDQVIATKGESEQYTAYYRGASIASNADSYNAIYRLLEQYGNSYVHIVLPSTPALNNNIEEDSFYKKLEEYCENADTPESQKEKDAKNATLSEGNAASTAANSEKGYPTGTLDIGDNFPSKLLNQQGGETKTTGNLSGNVDGDDGREDAVENYKSSINAAKNFLNNLDKILTEGLANLYVAEYAMQMFSYYTVDKKFDPDNYTVETIKDEELLSLSGYPLKDNKGYQGEVEYILWGNPKLATNIKSTVAMIFGIRLLLNSFFAFTNRSIIQAANTSATLIAGAAPYLIPIVQVIIQLGMAAVETSFDITDIKEGYGVTIIKDTESWVSLPGIVNMGGNNNKRTTLDYSEYLRIFLNINMLGNLEIKKLARIGDCIQANTNVELKEGYTMMRIEAKVKSRTTFMRKISEMGSGGWISPDDSYPILYQSILGY